MIIKSEADKSGHASWHALSREQALKELGSALEGLSGDEADGRLAADGPNRLPEGKRRGAVVRFLGQFHNILIYVLVGSAVITALLGHYTDMAVILAVVLINALIGFVQEGKAERAMAAISAMLAPQASVLRDGRRQKIASEALVRGDIVLLEAGDRVPADLRLLKAHALAINEAILTGESMAAEKGSAPVAAGAALGDRHSMAYSGAIVTSGSATGLVVATGGATEIGRISAMLGSVAVLKTPLLVQMDRFARWLSLLILFVALLLLAFGYYVDHIDFSDMFMAVVGLSVAAIPEGLPAVLTITLAVGVQAMAKRNAIIRRLPAIETLGSVSVICTDKTGTLTRNEMMAVSFLSAGRGYRVAGDGYDPEGGIRSRDGDAADRDSALIEEAGRTALLCNDASLQNKDGVWMVEGDPMEGALVAFAARAGLDRVAERLAFSRIDVLPFDARHRFMATLNRAEDGALTLHVKGAPETLIALAANQRSRPGETAPLDAAFWHEAATGLASAGQRVLALARLDAAPGKRAIDKDMIDGRLTLLGLIGFIDPPRPEAVTAVAECIGAGIDVKMITGDHRDTAAAIAREIGLKNSDDVLTGDALDSMDDAALALAVRQVDIFARTSPEHKLRLVTALQSLGMTVAMTGDGVNDAPALKRADAGIAMGRKGSEAAREVSDLVLADDNFASIVAAVREGRTVYDNIRKVISWTLPTSSGEAMTIIVALLFGMTLPVSPVQILWVNLITAATLGLALAFEPTEDNTMLRKPRRRDEPLIDGKLLWHIIFVSTLFLLGVFSVFSLAADKGYSLALQRSMAVNTLVVMEIFHLFFIRNIHGTSLTWKAIRGTPIVWATVAVVTMAQFAITYLPFLQRIFGTEAVPLVDGLIIIAVGIAPFIILETEKQISLALAGDRRDV